MAGVGILFGMFGVFVLVVIMLGVGRVTTLGTLSSPAVVRVGDGVVWVLAVLLLYVLVIVVLIDNLPDFKIAFASLIVFVVVETLLLLVALLLSCA